MPKAIHLRLPQYDGRHLPAGEISFGHRSLRYVASADGAYGIISADRDPAPATDNDRDGGTGGAAPRLFVKGNYFVEIAANRRAITPPHCGRGWRLSIRIITGSTALPKRSPGFPPRAASRCAWCPKAFLAYACSSAVTWAQYDFGKAFVAYETSPDSASAIMQKLRARFGRSRR